MKKELVTTVATLAAAACLLAACSGTEEKIPGNESGGNPSDRAALCIEQASMSQADAVDTRSGFTRGASTRADAVSTPITTGSMGVFLANLEGSSDYLVQNNVPYNVSKDPEDNTKYVWSSEYGLFFGVTPAHVCAYWPYMKTVGGDVSYDNSKAIPLKTQVYASDQDLCYAGNREMKAPTGAVNGGETPANHTSFAMTHAYALLELNLKRAGTSNVDCPVSKIEITASSGLSKMANVDITSTVVDGVYKSLTTYDKEKMFTLDYSKAPLVIPIGETKPVEALLIVPTAAAAETTFKFTLTAFDPAITVSGSTIFKDVQFKKGMKYIVNLTVNSTSVGVSGVTVESWTDTPIKPDGGGNGFVPLPPVTP